MRERIDLAFHIMDREYGVTRLLDPEGKPSFTVIGSHLSSCHIYHISASWHKQETDSLFVSCFQIRQGWVGWVGGLLVSLAISMGRGGSGGF